MSQFIILASLPLNFPSFYHGKRFQTGKARNGTKKRILNSAFSRCEDCNCDPPQMKMSIDPSATSNMFVAQPSRLLKATRVLYMLIWSSFECAWMLIKISFSNCTMTSVIWDAFRRNGTRNTRVRDRRTWSFKVFSPSLMVKKKLFVMKIITSFEIIFCNGNYVNYPWQSQFSPTGI